MSTVACAGWADWSIVPFSPLPSLGEGGRLGASIEVCREEDKLGRSLWVYWVREKEGRGQERGPLREVGWFFADEGAGVEGGVGAYVARLTVEGGEGDLEARIDDGEVGVWG